MISVVIPTHNRKDFVREAISSVLGQQSVPEKMEVIVVDDGSTDGTCENLARFAEDIRLIRQAHAGVSAARNRGILESRGQWIALLDSDDLWLPRKLSIQMQYLYDNPELHLCQTEEVWLRNGKRLNPRKYHKKPTGHCFPLLLERCLVSPSASVIRRNLFDIVGLFDESLPACEDYDFWLRVGCRFPIGLVDEPLIIKRGGHHDQLSASTPTLDKYRIRSIVKLLRTELLAPDLKNAAERVLASKARIYADGCRKHGRFDEADKIYALVREVLAQKQMLQSLTDFSE